MDAPARAREEPVVGEGRAARDREEVVAGRQCARRARSAGDRDRGERRSARAFGEGRQARAALAVLLHQARQLGLGVGEQRPALGRPGPSSSARRSWRGRQLAPALGLGLGLAARPAPRGARAARARSAHDAGVAARHLVEQLAGLLGRGEAAGGEQQLHERSASGRRRGPPAGPERRRARGLQVAPRARSARPGSPRGRRWARLQAVDRLVVGLGGPPDAHVELGHLAPEVGDLGPRARDRRRGRGAARGRRGRRAGERPRGRTAMAGAEELMGASRTLVARRGGFRPPSARPQRRLSGCNAAAAYRAARAPRAEGAKKTPSADGFSSPPRA